MSRNKSVSADARRVAAPYGVRRLKRDKSRPDPLAC